MPVLRNEHVWKWVPKNNWHFSILCARGQLAILREDEKEWLWCVDVFEKTMNEVIDYQGIKGHISETKRDVTHAQFQLGGIIQFLEMAEHQGIDIDIDIVKVAYCFEYHARIMMGEVPEGLKKEDIKTPYGYWYEPIWELALVYFGRKKIPMPITKKWIAKSKLRPERICFHWGGCTLTHYQKNI